ncbi:27039_t:CDS:2 [Gigaspora margarita]|uniref:2-oxoisovalerate dehydrogenase subunit alpha n=1 Tax=Gigaspora margarita TaxID=4874 RepID=A0ABN7VIE2_GIGMA|nr:27039_t:CDS:2 [Gigaspora margarita]
MSTINRRALTMTTKLLKNTLDEKASYPGATESYFTTEMKFIQSIAPIPTYRVMDLHGKVIDPTQEPQVSKEFAVKIYKDMITLNIMDFILYEAQRQGRISFYMTNYGEEAYIGSAAALDSQDVIYGQYRESGVLLYRGFTLDNFMNQCYSNENDIGKGRQMPIHYGSKELNFQTISSPVATQLPQASGAAYALKRSGKKNCIMCYFGEGAASEEQYKGDGIASRGIGYGIDTIRVDGNDVWAVYNATKAARQLSVEEHRPVLLESMTYRVSHHSTSDDSFAYRSKKEVEYWKQLDNPIVRFRKWLEDKNWWSEHEENSFRTSIRKEVLNAFSKAEKLLKPSITDLFNDVYDHPPQSIIDQRQKLKTLIERYPENYPLKNFKNEGKDL